MEHVLDCDADVTLISETWLRAKKNDVTAAVSEYGYTLHHSIRKNRAKELGGGVGVLVKKSLTSKLIKVKQFQTFKHCVVKINLLNNKWVTFISIYRLDYEAIDVFFTEFTELLEFTVSEKCIIAGDINIHCDVVDDGHTVQLNNLLTAFNLTQVIDVPTHNKGHTLDVVIARIHETKIAEVDVSDIALSDHYLLSFSADCTAPMSYYKTITYRKKVNSDKFHEDLVNTLDSINIGNELSETVNEYNNKLAALVDNHGPKVTKKVKIVDDAPWFDTEYKELRKERRKAERRFKRTQSLDDKNVFRELRKRTTSIAKEKKQQHYISQIQNANNKPKMLFKVVKNLMDTERASVFPTSTSDKQLANDFQMYFKDKIVKIRESFPPAETASIPLLPDNVKQFSTFELATEDEIRTIVVSYGVSCSPEDPIPIKILIEHIDVLIPFWIELVNLSLSTGSMDCLKSGVLAPLLKEAEDVVDTEVFKNFRPVTNLMFLSKLIERCVATRLKEHMKNSRLESKHEWGYKTGHSTELLLVKIVDSLLTAFDKKLATVLLLLDLSAAFDTVDQTKLLHILHYEIGLSGTVYKWFESFITGRSQRVKINEEYSDVELLLYGLSQGSVLGPPLFNIYIRPLYPYIQKLKFEIEGFADDHQLFKSFLPVCQMEVLGSGINDCLQSVAIWMNEYFLKLNKSKTKILVLAPPTVMSSIAIKGTFIENKCMRFVSSAKNLGVWLDEFLDFSTHVRKVVSASFMVIRAIAKIKSFLPHEYLCSLVCSLVLSRLDYCNALYYNIHQNEISLLQSAQNAALRLISGKWKYDRVSLTPLFEQLHWLKIKERIVFKICLIVHKCVWRMAPESFNTMMVMSNSRTLKLVEKKFSTRYGKRAISCAGPKLWNNIPIHIRKEEDTENFKKLLKSYLMMEANDFYRLVNMR